MRREWYQKLADSGFEDIEDTESQSEFLKSWHSHYFQARNTPESFLSKREYFTKARAFLEAYSFFNEFEKQVWMLHAEGLSYREIASELKAKGMRANKDSVNKVVLSVSTLMKAEPL